MWSFCLNLKELRPQAVHSPYSGIFIFISGVWFGRLSAYRMWKPKPAARVWPRERHQCLVFMSRYRGKSENLKIKGHFNQITKLSLASSRLIQVVYGAEMMQRFTERNILPRKTTRLKYRKKTCSFVYFSLYIEYFCIGDCWSNKTYSFLSTWNFSLLSESGKTKNVNFKCFIYRSLCLRSY